MELPAKNCREHPRNTKGIGLSQSEVAAIIGVSRQRVYEIEHRALQKLARDPVLQQYAEELLGVHRTNEEPGYE